MYNRGNCGLPYWVDVGRKTCNSYSSTYIAEAIAMHNTVCCQSMTLVMKWPAILRPSGCAGRVKSGALFDTRLLLFLNSQTVEAGVKMGKGGNNSSFEGLNRVYHL